MVLVGPPASPLPIRALDIRQTRIEDIVRGRARIKYIALREDDDDDDEYDEKRVLDEFKKEKKNQLSYHYYYCSPGLKQTTRFDKWGRGVPLIRRTTDRNITNYELLRFLCF